MKILILGAKGMLGTELSATFENLNPTIWDKENLDITKKTDVENKISKLDPLIIINAAAYTAVDDCESNEYIANLVNGKAVENLAIIANELKAILIHYSTDYVFNGQKKEGYKEDDQPEPINAYGKSKLIGEKAVQKYCKNFYLIRTSWLYGKNGKNFVETIIKLGQTQNEVKVVNDQFGKPTYAVDLAKKTRKLIESKKEYGIYHITNEEETTWYKFAQEIFWQMNISTKLIPITSDQFSRPAKRPYYSSLINTKLSPLRNWQQALKDYLKNR